MRQEFGSHPADLIAAIGPGISPCCYSVGVEVLDRFTEEFSYASELFSQEFANPGSPAAGCNPHLDLRLNLKEANRRQLLAAGLRADSIAMVGGCTACQPELFYSHRASGGHAGRMMAVIGIR
jgi:copper oxidase (laccase) domain-containing protein